ncbi:hypothetical protein MSAN_02219700 [Mycena sanguinolenta]|uniref:Uncharacterized protein n=1 Tax=Mycena sanguinolenta TaxID=230812 RepID=A0A8H7CIR2_9AGAR|nr:hypothetical protein MSAN_02219700 [Mycena sanguinolenta]
MSSSSPQRTLFVTLAAQAMSSVGFSVSILAWIWLTLYPPTKPELTEPIPVAVDKKTRRRSAPAALPAHKRRSPSPSIASAETQPSTFSPQRTRRVYFVDSPIASPSRPTNVQRLSNDSSDLSLHGSPTSEISPSSSSSTLVHTFTAIPPQTLETCRESAIESDSSTSSPRPSLSLSRPFQKARPRRSSTTSSASVLDIAPSITGPADSKQRRSSGGLIPPWSFRRVSGPKNSVSIPASSSITPGPASSSTSSASPASAPTPLPVPLFGRKAARRVSTPVPRTQPYAYPYYAQPPIEDEGYTAYLRNLPQFSNEVPVLARSPGTSDSEEALPTPAPSDQRGRNRKTINDRAQAALGLGRRGHPRSASESWAAGYDPRT